jgi:type II restriction enzyme
VQCAHEFELKGKRAEKTIRKVNDGAYSSMLERIASINSPHFFFLGYSTSFSVTNLLAVPNYFFQPSVIEKRKPLADTARRAGWVGCNILLDQIPEIGKIKLVENGEIVPQGKVLKTWQKTAFLAQQKQIEARGWTLDVMKCIERLHSSTFNLEAVYNFEPELSKMHSNNHFIKDKIRQQLQILRDVGYIEFVSRGSYRLVS